FEQKVCQGEHEVLGKSILLALIVELNGSGSRYRFDERELGRKFHSFGFEAYKYSPFQRRLEPVDSDKNRHGNNTLFVRQSELVNRRLKSASPVPILGVPV